MKLAFQKLGSGRPLLILHGLFGSSDNWYSIGKKLSEYYEVYLVDQRNHGRSPHDPEHNYEVMQEDLHEFILDHHLQPVMLLGHSMGGKTAMLYAIKHPELVSRLIVVDISPVDYNNAAHIHQSAPHSNIINALQMLKVETIESRLEADQRLKKNIPQQRVRQFLLKNLKQNKEGHFQWNLHIEAIAENMPVIAGEIVPPDKASSFATNLPALFVKSEFSHYIMEEDEEVILKLFPSARFIQIPKTSHWLHAEQPEAFVKTVLEFTES